MLKKSFILFFNSSTKKSPILSLIWLGWFTSIFIIPISSSFAAEVPDKSADFYAAPNKGKKGFYGYEVIKEEEKKEDMNNDKPSTNKISPIADKDTNGHRLPSLKDYSVEVLWNMHPVDFKELANDFRRKAIMTLKPQDVEEYYVVQDIGRRKALGFSNVASYVVSQNPALNLNKDSPLATPGRNAQARQQINNIENTIANSTNDFALLYFSSPACEYCSAQDNILVYFLRKYDMEVKKVNINTERELAVRFNISMVPIIVLVYRNNPQHFIVSMGVVSVSELESNIFKGIRLLKGEITPSEYSIYDFQKGGGFDVENILNQSQK